MTRVTNLGLLQGQMARTLLEDVAMENGVLLGSVCRSPRAPEIEFDFGIKFERLATVQISEEAIESVVGLSALLELIRGEFAHSASLIRGSLIAKFVDGSLPISVQARDQAEDSEQEQLERIGVKLVALGERLLQRSKTARRRT